MSASSDSRRYEVLGIGGNRQSLLAAWSRLDVEVFIRSCSTGSSDWEGVGQEEREREAGHVRLCEAGANGRVQRTPNSNRAVTEQLLNRTRPAEVKRV